MAHIRFLDTSRNDWVSPTSTVVASSFALGLPASYAQHPDRSRVWRSLAATTAHTLDLDAGVAVTASCCALANVLVPVSGVVEVYSRGSGASAGASTLVATLPAQDAETRAAFVFFTSATARHWQLVFTNPTSASAYAEVGYVHLGGYFEPAQNVIVPTAAPRKDPSVVSASVDGQVTVRRRTTYADGAWVFQEVPEAQLDIYRAFWRETGVGGVFFHVLDLDLSWTCWLARATGEMQRQFGVLAGRYSVALPWEEVR